MGLAKWKIGSLFPISLKTTANGRSSGEWAPATAQHLNHQPQQPSFLPTPLSITVAVGFDHRRPANTITTAPSLSSPPLANSNNNKNCCSIEATHNQPVNSVTAPTRSGRNKPSSNNVHSSDLHSFGNNQKLRAPSKKPSDLDNFSDLSPLLPFCVYV